MPDVDIVLINRPDQSAVGPGEPAIANAIYNAVGVRIRDVPFLPRKIRVLLSH